MKFTFRLIFFILFLGNLPITLFGYNILGLFPIPIASHFYFAQTLLKGLALKGHNLTVVSYFPEDDPIPNYTDIEITGHVSMKETINLSDFEGRTHNPWEEFHMIQEWGLNDCEKALKSDAIKKLLNMKIKFDVIIVEQFNNDCILGVSHLLEAPLISLSSCAPMSWLYDRMNTPVFQSFMPPNNYGEGDNMIFIDRIKSYILYHATNFWYKQITRRKTNALVRKYLGDSIPDVDEIAEKTTALLLINQHYTLTGIKPYGPNIIEVGGLQIQEPKALNSEIKMILDSSKSGVIYINWGSMIRSETLPVAKREAIIKAVSRLDQTVLWKWENETLPNQPKNVHIRKWMPQREILAHPNVKVFMSHGGLLGTSESAYSGIPMVITPIFGDQFLNAYTVTGRGMGLVLHYKDITEENVYNVLKKALSPQSQKSAAQISDAYRNRPDTPLNTAIWWVERVAKTKGNLLNRPTNILPIYIYYSYDVYGFFAVILLIVYIVLRYSVKFIYSKTKKNNIVIKLNKKDN